MDTKLTLSLNKQIIEQAKLYAKSHQISLSKLIESYLTVLTHQSAKNTIQPTTLVESLSGVISLDTKEDIKDEYTNFLIEKYK